MKHRPIHEPVRFPLTSSQCEIWFDQMVNAGLPLYNIGGYIDLPGKIDIELFKQAAQQWDDENHP